MNGPGTAERFLPGRHPIDAFGNGGFRFGGMSHLGSLLIVPSGMRACPVSALTELRAHDLAQFLLERQNIDFLLIGTGQTMQRPARAILDHLAEAGLRADYMDTHAAVRTYNVVLAEDRRVAALLLAVENASA